MHLLLVNLYEFGLFLRILLWISVPLIVVALLVTTWIHYRSRHKAVDELRLSMEGMDITADPADLLVAIQGRQLSVGTEEAGDAEAPTGKEEAFSERERNRMYKGILWMKEKYEQYRDLADRRIEQLKDELVRSEQRYQDLLDRRAEERTPDKAELPTPDKAELPTPDKAELPAPDKAEHPTPEVPEHQFPEAVDDRERRLLEEKDHQLESKDRQIEELQSQLQKHWRKTEELVSKLQNSSQLLLKISRELDGSLPQDPIFS